MKANDPGFRLPVWGGVLLMLCLEGCVTGAPSPALFGDRRTRPRPAPAPAPARPAPPPSPPGITYFL